jgi:Reverse transcriptase (RNA-dependent DNA polymerase)/RNase H-like domain found in reverse transcriptase
MDTGTNEIHVRILAASSATQEEIETAKTRYNDGSKPVTTEKRPYRPKLASQYEEPAYLPDDDDTLELLYRNGGVAISKHKAEIGEREPCTIIKYKEEKHGETLKKSLQWEDCPEKLRPRITDIVKQYWDVFAPEGLRHHIRGFVCHIDTGNAQPMCCKIPRYGPHEARVITQLARGLEENGLIEEARSPWGAQVVLAAKPNQDHVHWSEYVWRLAVSYRQLNTITRPFIYPSRRCDDAARDIGKSKYFITMDFESGFWQVLLHEQSRDKTAFFVPDGQKRWTVMPMGCLNAHGAFCCLVDTLKRQWNTRATEAGIRDDIEVTLKGQRPWTDAEVIVDDIMLHSEKCEPLLQYFEIVLQVLQKHQVTVKLKKCRFFPQSAEFVGMDIEADGNRPARSKMQALEDLQHQPPRTVTDLRQLIGLIGFYQDWIANYELRIGRWRQHIKTVKASGATESDTKLDTVWQEEDNKLLKVLVDELIKRPTLARPDYTRRFYLKTDWCRLGMAAVLLQADPTDAEAEEHERQETEHKEQCKFDKHMHQLRLRPITFASRKCTAAESNLHSYTGEAATGVWAVEKYKRHLFGK